MSKQLNSIDFILDEFIKNGVYLSPYFLQKFREAKQMHNEEMQTQHEEGREIGKIEVLTTQSTSNASAYSDGYKKGYLAALEYMNSTIENKIKLRKYEQ